MIIYQRGHLILSVWESNVDPVIITGVMIDCLQELVCLQCCGTSWTSE